MVKAVDGDSGACMQHTVDSALAVLLRLHAQGHGDLPLCMADGEPVVCFNLSSGSCGSSCICVSDRGEQE